MKLVGVAYCTAAVYLPGFTGCNTIQPSSKTIHAVRLRKLGVKAHAVANRNHSARNLAPHVILSKPKNSITWHVLIVL